MKFTNAKLIGLIKSSLTTDLLKKEFKYNINNPLAGHCYICSEAAFYLFAKKNGYKPCFIKHEGVPHWFLKKDNKIIDITKNQFKNKNVPYSEGRNIGFLTKQPSKRTQILLMRVIKKILSEENKL